MTSVSKETKGQTLIDENAYTDEALAGLKNVVAATIRLKRQQRPQDLARLTAALHRWFATRLRSASSEELETWAERVLDVSRLEDVFEAQEACGIETTLTPASRWVPRAGKAKVAVEN